MAGRARADVLRHVLKDAGIDAIGVTATRRSQQTAESLATALGLDATIHGEDDLVTAIPPAMAAIRPEPSSAVVLVVGHWHTLSNIIAGLAAWPIPMIRAAEFDRLFVQVESCLTHRRFGV